MPKDRLRKLAQLVRPYRPADLWSGVCAWATRPERDAADGDSKTRAALEVLRFLSPAGSKSPTKTTYRRIGIEIGRGIADSSDLSLPLLPFRRWPAAGGEFCIHPGPRDRPYRDLSEITFASRIVDKHAIELFGFGICDILELHLRHSDAVLRALEPFWETATALPDLKETNHYAAQRSLQQIADTCTFPARARLALDNMTSNGPVKIPRMMGDSFAPFLRARTRAGLFDLPPAVGFEATLAASQNVARRTFEQRPSALDEYSRAAANKIRTYLETVGAVAELPEDAFRVSIDEHRHILVQSVVGESLQLLSDGIDRIERTKSIGDTGHGVIITTSPARLGVAKIGLNNWSVLERCDLDFITQNARRSEDLFFFTKGRMSPRLGRQMHWDALDQWTVWESSGSFPHGTYQFTTFSPHGCSIEWERWMTPSIERDDPLVPHRSLLAEAQRNVYARLQCPDQQPLAGAAAAGFLKNRVVPAADAAVTEAIRSYDDDSLIRLLCARLDALTHRGAEENSDEQYTRLQFAQSCRLAIEKSLSEARGGASTPRPLPAPLDAQLVIASTSIWLDAAMAGGVVGRGLSEVSVELKHQGEYLVIENGAGLLDLGAYRLARETSSTRNDAVIVPWLPGRSSILRSSDRPSPAWLEVLQEFEDEFGVELEALFHVLASLCEVCSGPYDHADLERIASEGWRGETLAIAKAIRMLVLRAEDLQKEGLRPWQNQERAYRLFSRPLVELPRGQIGVMRAWIRTSIVVFAGYLGEGRLPFPPSAYGSTLSRRLSAFRNEITRQFELGVASILDTGNLSYMRNIKRAAEIGIPSLSGEIDFIVADPVRKILWVLEVKDPVQDFSLDAIRRSVARFADSDRYFDKLRRKVGDISRDPTSVARAMGLDGVEWMTSGAFVTREAVPAAFVDSEFAFIVLDEVLDHFAE